MSGRCAVLAVAVARPHRDVSSRGAAERVFVCGHCPLFVLILPATRVPPSMSVKSSVMVPVGRSVTDISGPAGAAARFPELITGGKRAAARSGWDT
jgi:hypothetical protein